MIMIHVQNKYILAYDLMIMIHVQNKYIIAYDLLVHMIKSQCNATKRLADLLFHCYWLSKNVKNGKSENNHAK